VFSNVVGCGPANIDSQIATFAPAQLLQGLCKRREAILSFRIVRAQIHEHANAPRGLALLRTRCDRPCYRAAE
jgi:hypothetical protein